MSSVPEIGKNKGTPHLNLSYKKWLELKKYRPRSISTLLSFAKKTHNYLSSNDLELSMSNLIRYAHWSLEQGYSLRYENHIQWGLKTYYSYLQAVLGWSGALALPKLLPSSNRRKALTGKEMESLKEWLLANDNELRQVLWLLFYGCGLRRSEVLNLRLLDIKYQSKLVVVRSSKNGIIRQIPLSSSQLLVVQRYVQNSRPVPRQGFEGQLLVGKRGGKAAALLALELEQWQLGSGLGPRLCWHVLRHTIASELVHSGMEIRLVSQFLGHRSLCSTHHYLHVKQES